MSNYYLIIYIGNRNGNGELLHRMSNGLLGHNPSQPNVDRFVCRRLYNSDWNISYLYDTQIVMDNWYNSNVYPTIATLRPVCIVLYLFNKIINRVNLYRII